MTSDDETKIAFEGQSLVDLLNGENEIWNALIESGFAARETEFKFNMLYVYVDQLGDEDPTEEETEPGETVELEEDDIEDNEEEEEKAPEEKSEEGRTSKERREIGVEFLKEWYEKNPETTYKESIQALYDDQQISISPPTLYAWIEKYNIKCHLSKRKYKDRKKHTINPERKTLAVEFLKGWYQENPHAFNKEAIQALEDAHGFSIAISTLLKWVDEHNIKDNKPEAEVISSKKETTPTNTVPSMELKPLYKGEQDWCYACGERGVYRFTKTGPEGKEETVYCEHHGLLRQQQEEERS